MNAFLEQNVFCSAGLFLALNAALAALLVCALGLSAAWTARHRPAPLRYGLVLAALVLALCSPALSGLAHRIGVGRLGIPVRIAPTVPTMGTSVETPLPVASSVQTTPVAADPAARHSEPPSRSVENRRRPAIAWWQTAGTLLAGVWLAGIAMGFARLVWGYAQLARFRRTLLPAHSPAMIGSLQRACRLLGLGRVPPLWTSPCAPTPMVIGLWRPAIVLPEGLDGELTQDQFDAVLLHETAHIVQRDVWVAQVQRLAEVLLWWCPLLHCLSRRLTDLREQICDNYVMRTQGDGFGLAEVLVRLAERIERLARPRLTGALGIVEPAGDGLEGRVARLVQKECNTMTRMNWTAMAITGAFALLLGGAMLVTQVRAAEKPKDAATAQTPELCVRAARQQGQFDLELRLPGKGSNPRMTVEAGKWGMLEVALDAATQLSFRARVNADKQQVRVSYQVTVAVTGGFQQWAVDDEPWPVGEWKALKETATSQPAKTAADARREAIAAVVWYFDQEVAKPEAQRNSLLKQFLGERTIADLFVHRAELDRENWTVWLGRPANQIEHWDLEANFDLKYQRVSSWAQGQGPVGDVKALMNVPTADVRKWPEYAAVVERQRARQVRLDAIWPRTEAEAARVLKAVRPELAENVAGMWKGDFYPDRVQRQMDGPNGEHLCEFQFTLDAKDQPRLRLMHQWNWQPKGKLPAIDDAKAWEPVAIDYFTKTFGHAPAGKLEVYSPKNLPPEYRNRKDDRIRSPFLRFAWTEQPGGQAVDARQVMVFEVSDWGPNRYWIWCTDTSAAGHAGAASGDAAAQPIDQAKAAKADTVIRGVLTPARTPEQSGWPTYTLTVAACYKAPPDRSVKAGQTITVKTIKEIKGTATFYLFWDDQQGLYRLADPYGDGGFSHVAAADWSEAAEKAARAALQLLYDAEAQRMFATRPIRIPSDCNAATDITVTKTIDTITLQGDRAAVTVTDRHSVNAKRNTSGKVSVIENVVVTKEEWQRDAEGKWNRVLITGHSSQYLEDGKLVEVPKPAARAEDALDQQIRSGRVFESKPLALGGGLALSVFCQAQAAPPTPEKPTPLIVGVRVTNTGEKNVEFQPSRLKLMLKWGDGPMQDVGINVDGLPRAKPSLVLKSGEKWIWTVADAQLGFGGKPVYLAFFGVAEPDVAAGYRPGLFFERELEGKADRIAFAARYDQGKPESPNCEPVVCRLAGPQETKKGVEQPTAPATGPAASPGAREPAAGAVRVRILSGSDRDPARDAVEEWIAKGLAEAGSPVTSALTDWITLSDHEREFYSSMQGGRIIKGRVNDKGEVEIAGMKIGQSPRIIAVRSGQKQVVKLTNYPGAGNVFIAVESVTATAPATAPGAEAKPADSSESTPGEEIAWGKETNGVVANLRALKTDVQPGDPIEFEIQVKNVSQKDVYLLSGEGGKKMDATCWLFRFDQWEWSSPIPSMFRSPLKPGETASVRCVVRTTRDSLSPDQKYRHWTAPFRNVKTNAESVRLPAGNYRVYAKWGFKPEIPGDPGPVETNPIEVRITDHREPKQSVLVITDADNGKTIKAVVDQAIEVRLRFSGWEAQAVEGGVLEFAGKRLEPIDGAFVDKPLHTAVFTYRAVKAGQAKVQMKYVPTNKAFAVAVDVMERKAELGATSATRPAAAVLLDPDRLKLAPVVLRVLNSGKLGSAKDFVEGVERAAGDYVEIVQVYKNEGPDKELATRRTTMLWHDGRDKLPVGEFTAYLRPHVHEKGPCDYDFIGGKAFDDAKIEGSTKEGISHFRQNAAGRAAKLLGDLKTFTLQLIYIGQQEKPYYHLLLSVPPLPGPDRNNPFYRQARVTEQQARAIIEHLVKDGYFDDALDGNRNRAPAPPKEPYYTLGVRVENGGNPVTFKQWLPLDSPMLYQRLDGLRGVLEGDAAKDMDLLIGRLAGERRALKQPADTRPAAKDAAIRPAADARREAIAAVVWHFDQEFAKPEAQRNSHLKHFLGDRTIADLFVHRAELDEKNSLASHRRDTGDIVPRFPPAFAGDFA